MDRYVSTSGRTSFGAVEVLPVVADLSFACVSVSISEDASGPSKDASSFPRAAKSVFATEFVEVYVSVMTCARRSCDRCFRIDEIDRRTRKVKRASNCATARSNNAKFDFTSGIT